MLLPFRSYSTEALNIFGGSGGGGGPGGDGLITPTTPVSSEYI